MVCTSSARLDKVIDSGAACAIGNLRGAGAIGGMEGAELQLHEAALGSSIRKANGCFGRGNGSFGTKTSILVKIN